MSRGGEEAPAPDRWRFVPIVGWLRGYDRRWLRGDLIAGVAVAALIVPEEPRLRGHRGDPAAERAVRGSRRRHPVRDLRDLPADLDRPELGPGRGGGQRGRGRRASPATTDVASFVAVHHAGLRRAVPAARRAQDGLDRAVPVAGRGHRLPVRRGDRRRDRRAPQAHRAPTSPARTRSRSCGPGSGRSATPAWRRCSSAASPSSSCSGVRVVAPQVPGALVLVVGRAAGVLAVRPRRPRRRPGRRRAQRACPSSSVPDLELLWDHAGTIALAAVALVLIGFSQTAGDCPDVRGQAPLPDRHQPGVGGAGHGQRRRRPVPGDAGLDQPVRQLAQRPHRRPHRPRVDHVGRHRAAHAAVAGAALLRPAQAGAGRPDHRGGGDGDDGRARDAPPVPRAAASTSGSRSPRSWGPCCSACSPAS